MPPDATPNGVLIVRLTEVGISQQILSAQSATPPQHVVLDFSAVTYVASIDLGHLLKLRQHLHAHDRRVCLFALQPAVRNLFRITSLDLVLDLHDHEAAAVASLK